MKDNELKALISLLDDEDTEVYDQIADKIVSLGENVIPYLETEWEKNFNPFVQHRIEELVHTLQFNSAQDKLRDWSQKDEQDLMTGLWIIATYQYPDYSIEKLTSDLEQMYYEAWTRYKNNLHPYDQIKLLNSIIFQELKFGSNLKNFHSPSNSYINCVIESKKGNPISICVIYMLIAQKLNLPIYGVNLPNLFILTYKDDKIPQFYINAYNKGIIFTRKDIENYIKELKIDSNDNYFVPCSNKDIIKRMLSNLIISYEKAGEREKALEVVQLRDILS